MDEDCGPAEGYRAFLADYLLLMRKHHMRIGVARYRGTLVVEDISPWENGFRPESPEEEVEDLAAATEDDLGGRW